MNRLALALVLAAGLATPSDARAAPTVLLHGNYCGPGNRAPLPPVDALDLACARHDSCTPRRGLPSAACNARLWWEANAVAHDPRQPPDLQFLAGIVAMTASLLPSDPRATAVTDRSAPAVPVAAPFGILETSDAW